MAEEPFVSLYRRFRPGRFSELRGQPHVVLALRSAVRDGHVAHAYLFSGPRGTGKTSTARILAKALNCANPQTGEPCGECPSCIEITRGTSLDVHELDAASNNGVDAMRDLISHAALGTPGRWKVYIVDEVHMLSNAAANALLKTLEEPPSHVIFVLATTDPQKVPPTIRSRTQHFEFRLLGADTLAGLLADVNDAAGLSLDEAAVALAVRRGRGSARDALSALDQVAASGSAEDARPELSEVVDALGEEDAGRALVAVAALHEAGWGPQQLAAELVEELRLAFLVAMAPELAGVEGADLARLSEQSDRLGLARMVRSIEVLGRAQVEMRDAPDPRAVLEVALVRLARPELDDSPAGIADRLSRLERLVNAGGAAGAGAGAPTAPAPPTPLVATGPPADPRTKPSIGALRRQRAQAAPPLPEAPAPQGAPAPAPQGAPAPAPQGPPAPDPPAPDPAPAAPAAAGVAPGRDALVQAWGDHILRGLPARAKALYSAGRFVAMEGSVASFALPNAAHCARCEESRPIVEGAIAAYFGEPVSLDLVVDEGAAAPGPVPAAPRPVSAAAAPADAGGDGVTGLAEGDDYDPADADGAQAVESIAEARLLEAFPGAEEVTG
jgi:DNA polymerase-3 subunit gamma/tau